MAILLDAGDRGIVQGITIVVVTAVTGGHGLRCCTPVTPGRGRQRVAFGHFFGLRSKTVRHDTRAPLVADALARSGRSTCHEYWMNVQSLGGHFSAARPPRRPRARAECSRADAAQFAALSGRMHPSSDCHAHPAGP